MEKNDMLEYGQLYRCGSRTLCDNHETIEPWSKILRRTVDVSTPSGIVGTLWHCFMNFDSYDFAVV